ncbi:tail fiber domain-containing protein [Streptomyces levis]|uniref:tail fiber domain-containing protein n=1 Tax=Streptomyces levis TaxID=285566 RepID=UPI0031D2BBEF
MAAAPDFTLIRRATLYARLKDSEDRVGNGNWDDIGNLIRCIAHLAARNGRPVQIDLRDWQERWQRLEDLRRPRRQRDGELTSMLASDNWMGDWDGAADAVLAHSSAREFTVWPPGQQRLDSLAQAVARLGAAHESDLARDAARRLVHGATMQFGKGSPQTLAARHAFAFWTGQAGRVREALRMTKRLRAVCRKHLGPDHILCRLACLREAWWTGAMGRWHEAHRLYIETARYEASRPDRDQSIWLLARWGMARTGGRSGNWMHAHAELDELLPTVAATFGPDHPATLDACYAHAWSAGRAGHVEEACGLLDELAPRADAALGVGHPTSLRIRIALAWWTLRNGSHTQALLMANALSERCDSLLGPDHPLGVNVTEVEALCRFEEDQEASLAVFADILRRRKEHFGPDHPYTLAAASNHAAVLGCVMGPTVVVEVFADLTERSARVLGSEHPETLRLRINEVIATFAAEGAGAARPLCREAVDSLRKTLGTGHPDTVRAWNLLSDIEVQDDLDPARRPQPRYITHAGGGEGPGGSDRALKCDIAPVRWSSTEAEDQDLASPKDPPHEDGFAILRAVVSMPVSTWSYRGEEGVRHLGPMAQDWYAALGLGADDRTIHPIDANGVSVVAVQALYRMVSGLQDEVSRLRERLDER